MRFPPAWAHWYYSFVSTPCSLLKLHGSNPAQYFRRCQAVSLWLFMASNVFPFIAYFRCNKREMKGPLKANALPWHLSTLWDISRIAPEWMLPVPLQHLPCYLPHDVLFACWYPFSEAGFPPLQPAVQFAGDIPAGRTLLQKSQDAGACGWGQPKAQPKRSQHFRYFCIFYKPGQVVSALAEKLGKVLLVP